MLSMHLVFYFFFLNPSDLPSTSGMQQQTTSSIPAASVTGRPQQQVQIVQPQMESTGMFSTQ